MNVQYDLWFVLFNSWLDISLIKGHEFLNVGRVIHKELMGFVKM